MGGSAGKRSSSITIFRVLIYCGAASGLNFSLQDLPAASDSLLPVLG